MSSIARQLLDEIVEPVITVSKDSSIRGNKSKPASSCPSTTTQNGKTTRSVIIEKKRVVNKLTSKCPGSKRAIVETKVKSKEVLLHKHLTDSSMNTICSGPMKCDSKCATSIRRKTDSCCCKPNKQLLKPSTADIRIQKKSILLDKACLNCAETVNCGTQFYDTEVTNFSDNFGMKYSTDQSQKLCKDASVAVGKSFYTNTMQFKSRYCHDYFNGCRELLKPPESSPIKLFMGARRWSITKYPRRGADF